MSYTFKLHRGVRFHDGRELSSEHVKATYDRLRDPPAGVVSTRKATLAEIDTIETPDPLTVAFSLSCYLIGIAAEFGDDERQRSGSFISFARANLRGRVCEGFTVSRNG